MDISNYDFGGYATRNDLLCADGRIIRKDAFKECDGQTVPLIYNHEHNNPESVLGHAVLENRDDGMYAYCKFNGTKYGIAAKEWVQHGDVRSLSIYANKLKQKGADVVHGVIRELSLVLAGANPGAYIDFVMEHDDEGENGFYANYDENAITLYHSEPEVVEVEEEEEVVETETETETEEVVQHSEEDKKDADNETKSEGDDETVEDILSTLNDKQKIAVYYVLGELTNNTDNEEETEMKHNIFEQDNQQKDTLIHADIVNNAIADGKRFATLKDSILAHAAENNITDIQELFPNEHDLHMPPEWYKENDDSWVAKVMRGVHHVPFSRVRALFAKMDEATARAHGYIKGNEKQVGLKLSILKRTTKPTTVYIKMAMDRDDLIDIQYDALPWIRAEGRKVLDAELARAFLLGDGRDPGEDDKIDELCIRPILTDDEMYTITYTVTDGKDYHNDFNSASENDSEAKGVIRAAIKSRKGYKGSGNLTFFTTEELVTELLLIEDQNGRRIYESEAALCTALRVKEIVTVPELEQLNDVYGIFVNMNDYQVGADKGGQVTTFEDFDIDFNKEKILMETRCSAALVKPKSAIVLKKASAAG